MKILITGGCGFVGSNIAIYLKKKIKKVKIISLDNLSRSGSIINRNRLTINKMNQNILILNIKSLDRLKTPMNKVINVKYGIFKKLFFNI